ncbi:MAG: N-acetylmuramoyl-L-alanine amidase [Zetaproteobacteria bacterium CG06_land_8_20_14_3_00_59_53]|nr:MAG: N-acetylmuramoyl-L-alanine amidase [Zetaproteobacteria bacterium CG2_30_59_37]PIO90733.1 MAG: N-acetylmuramoyl-L-alanine amidase [Zetaproteobacteria bacterium CG23_combo_of_CG06-09_8_20_14_all_59_86]PIQ65305.1 MAG: N-acetylmuramoyl-L-alanine amidase [Zetaproteobacteria bacterium CG11_big_fil_rev_8_21_14_0_20_59_439]PIU69847.1 MAG: N-acetylmuramoyl-L-alanine amidase [Zetaproteobacteria bacterium CG06_land_8_20_14_3_00_59_53]PIU97373.1 MAG: N-acetylmuramoyl-L-alanine amidase [Zetaproteoba
MKDKIVTRLSGFLIVLCLFAGSLSEAYAAAPQIREARFWTAPDHTRAVLDLSAAVEYRAYSLHSPERVVVDIKGAELRTTLDNFEKNDPVLIDVRYGKPKPGTLRLVMDMREKVQIRTFLLKPMQGKPYRLVIDLLRAEDADAKVVAKASDHASKPIVIAVDAGHGGEDPGASGPHRLREKDITLAVAKRFAEEINNTPGLQAVLTRKGDYFVGLKKRVIIARKANADLMISIHADAVKQRDVSGASVYTLSDKGASDRVAALLAQKENSSDAVGGVMPGEVEDPLVQSILADLIKRDSLNSAEMLAEQILKHIGQVGPVKYGAPKHARFVVLTAAEIPSVLVELDYISNPERERLLRSSEHQDRLATALLEASRTFLKEQGRLPPTQLGRDEQHMPSGQKRSTSGQPQT